MRKKVERLRDKLDAMEDDIERRLEDLERSYRREIVLRSQVKPLLGRDN